MKHHAQPLSIRLDIFEWVTDDAEVNGKTYLHLYCKPFPQQFRNRTNATKAKEMRLQKEFLNTTKNEAILIARTALYGLKTSLVKARRGQGGKRHIFVDAMHCGLFEDFNRPSRLDENFCMCPIQLLALKVLKANDNNWFSADLLDPLTGHSLSTKTNKPWVRYVMYRLIMASWSCTDRHKMNHQKEMKLK